MEVRVLSSRPISIAWPSGAVERDRLLAVLRAGAAPRELSVTEVAALTRKCRQTIRNWIKAGRLPARADDTNHYYVPTRSGR